MNDTSLAKFLVGWDSFNAYVLGLGFWVPSLTSRWHMLINGHQQHQSMHDGCSNEQWSMMKNWINWSQKLDWNTIYRLPSTYATLFFNFTWNCHPKLLVPHATFLRSQEIKKKTKKKKKKPPSPIIFFTCF